MFSKILIANRSIIAVRIMRTCKDMQIETVGVYSDIDKNAAHVKLADESYCIGSPFIENSYLNMQKILRTAIKSGAQAIHPGYGFLSESDQFAKICLNNGIRFIGPKIEVMRNILNKNFVENTAGKLNIPIMALHQEESDKTKHARMNKYIAAARYIEVQLLADNFGNILVLGDRDCLVQKNYMKFIAESPSNIPCNIRKKLYADAKKLAEKLQFTGAGTVEFLVEGDKYYFVEFISRLQVEHGITEVLTGIDIVRWQIKIAAGEAIDMKQADMKTAGHALACRINSASCGKISDCQLPQKQNVRIDTAINDGYNQSLYYDALLAEIIVKANSRDDAVQGMKSFLTAMKIDGIDTNINACLNVLSCNEFKCNRHAAIFPNKSPACFKISAREKLFSLLDEISSFNEFDKDMVSNNVLNFYGYDEKLEKAKRQSDENEAVITGCGTIDRIKCIFIIGTMGIAVGEKVTRAFEYAEKHQLPVVTITASAGARMQDGTLALMQMAKTAGAVKRHSDRGLLYISVISNPTLGGVSAGFASLGDIIIAEDNAIYGFTDRRRAEETLCTKMPNDFLSVQSAIRHGQVDMVVDETDLRETLVKLLRLHNREHEHA